MFAHAQVKYPEVFISVSSQPRTYDSKLYATGGPRRREYRRFARVLDRISLAEVATAGSITTAVALFYGFMPAENGDTPRHSASHRAWAKSGPTH